MKKYLLLSLSLLVLCFCGAQGSHAWTAYVEFTPPANPAYVTDVLVSETSNDYSQAYGQRSEPGGSTVNIEGIKPETTYYFMAYRLVPGTWERSPNSEEMEVTTLAYVEPVLYSLPSLSVGGVFLNITVEVK